MAHFVRGPGGLLVPEESAPGTPPNGSGRYWAGADGKPYYTNDAGVTSDLSATGGSGSSPVLGSLYSNDYLGQAAPATRTAAAANGAYWVPIQIPFGASLTGLRYKRGTGTTAGNVIGALYDAAGNRVAQSGSVAVGTVASVGLSVPFSALYAAPAGLYWACLVHSAATNTFMGWAATNEYFGAGAYAAQGSFTAPATFTPPATSALFTAQPAPWVATY